MCFFVKSVPGSKDWSAQHSPLLFPYPKTTYHPTPPENVPFCGKCSRYRNTAIWVHIYYNSESRAAAEERFLRYYKNCFDEMKAGELDKSHQPFYDEYFTYGYKTKNGRKIIPLKDPVQVFSERLDGYWCLYTTSEKDARKAYQEYRERNDIEVLFDDLKNGQDCKRLRVHSPKTMRGRLFVQFIALIVDTKLRQMINEHQ